MTNYLGCYISRQYFSDQNGQSHVDDIPACVWVHISEEHLGLDKTWRNRIDGDTTWRDLFCHAPFRAKHSAVARPIRHGQPSFAKRSGIIEGNIEPAELTDRQFNQSLGKRLTTARFFLPSLIVKTPETSVCEIEWYVFLLYYEVTDSV